MTKELKALFVGAAVSVAAIVGAVAVMDEESNPRIEPRPNPGTPTTTRPAPIAKPVPPTNLGSIPLAPRPVPRIAQPTPPDATTTTTGVSNPKPPLQ